MRPPRVLRSYVITNNVRPVIEADWVLARGAQLNNVDAHDVLGFRQRRLQSIEEDRLLQPGLESRDRRGVPGPSSGDRRYAYRGSRVRDVSDPERISCHLDRHAELGW